MATVIGISGARRNACAAACVDGDVRAVCEQERLVRIRGVGLAPERLPDEAVDEVLYRTDCRRDDVAAYVVAEPDVRLPQALPGVRYDHHFAHAATAFFTSPFERATVLVCDSHSNPELSVWLGHGDRVINQDWPWSGPAFATLYSECAEILGFVRGAQEHQVEAMAHSAPGHLLESLRSLLHYEDGSITLEQGWKAKLRKLVGSDPTDQNPIVAEIASAIQHRLGELLVDLTADIRTRLNTQALCLAGGLFFNTYLNTMIRSSGIFEEIFVPVNPGNAGLAVGAALVLGRCRGERSEAREVSPFLGPEYDTSEIKEALEGCKLSYDFVNEQEVLDVTVEALGRGQLVGWFQGRMEWGPRALGNRSILANPLSPYVLDNLNGFLKKRQRSRGFGVSVCDDDLARYFCGPPASPFMEYEYSPLNPDQLRAVMPTGARSLRVQTVGRSAGLFRSLHKRMEQSTGMGVLVNTSFNGFREPIVCTPRDAVRVFYGTALDVLVIGRFILRK